MQLEHAVCPVEPGTPAGPSRRRFLRAFAAGAAGALAAPAMRLEASPAAVAGSGGWQHPPGKTDSETAYWERVRREFLVSDELAYLNSGTLGPMPKPVYYAVVDSYRALSADPGRENTRHIRAQGGLREKLAAFVGADADEIALTRNTTEIGRAHV